MKKSINNTLQRRNKRKRAVTVTAAAICLSLVLLYGMTAAFFNTEQRLSARQTAMPFPDNYRKNASCPEYLSSCRLFGERAEMSDGQKLVCSILPEELLLFAALVYDTAA